MEDFTGLTPPLTIYVDEAGGSDFGPPREGQRKKAHAVVAAAIPTLAADAVGRMLPQDSEGHPMKSTHPKLSGAHASRFAESLISSQVDIGAFLMDPGGKESIEAAERAYASECLGRKQAQERVGGKLGKKLHPDISQHDYFYLLFLIWTVNACAGAYNVRNGHFPSFLDIVLDTKSIKPAHRERFVRLYRETFDKPESDIPRIYVRDIRWRSEQEEPLLLVPDLFGGILCRADRGYEDAFDAADKLWGAERKRRWKFLNTPPSEHEAAAE
jgi:hypothetical protein